MQKSSAAWQLGGGQQRVIDEWQACAHLRPTIRAYLVEVLGRVGLAVHEWNVAPWTLWPHAINGHVGNTGLAIVSHSRLFTCAAAQATLNWRWAHDQPGSRGMNNCRRSLSLAQGQACTQASYTRKRRTAPCKTGDLHEDGERGRCMRHLHKPCASQAALCSWLSSVLEEAGAARGVWSSRDAADRDASCW